MNAARMVFALLFSVTAAVSAKEPMPPQEQQRVALRENLQLVKAADCDTLLAAAKQSQDAAEVFVLLNQARKKAGERGDAVMALSIAEQIEEVFEFPASEGSSLDRLSATANSIASSGKDLVFVAAKKTSLDESRKHHYAILRVVAQLLAEDRYKEALALVFRLKAMAKTADDSDAVWSHGNTAAALQRMVNGNVDKLPEALGRMDVDPLKVGRALAVYTGDLDQAARYLSNGSRKDISELAKDELNFRTNQKKDSDVSEDLLDRWLGLAGNLPNDLQRTCYVFARAHCCWLLDNGNRRTQYPKASHSLRTLKDKNAQPDLLVVRRALGYPNIYPIFRAQFSYEFPPEDKNVPERLFYTETEWRARQAAKESASTADADAPRTFSDPRYNKLRKEQLELAKYSDEELLKMEQFAQKLREEYEAKQKEKEKK